MDPAEIISFSSSDRTYWNFALYFQGHYKIHYAFLIVAVTLCKVHKSWYSKWSTSGFYQYEEFVRACRAGRSGYIMNWFEWQLQVSLKWLKISLTLMRKPCALWKPCGCLMNMFFSLQFPIYDTIKSLALYTTVLSFFPGRGHMALWSMFYEYWHNLSEIMNKSCLSKDLTNHILNLQRAFLNMSLLTC